MSIKDVMETDWRDLLSILDTADGKPKENNEVMSLEEFIGQI
ncbi:hypothetical protein [Streptococcus chenjunshii]|nr:hypothetical protein [Streptococcus chenjunshii]